MIRPTQDPLVITARGVRVPFPAHGGGRHLTAAPEDGGVPACPLTSRAVRAPGCPGRSQGAGTRDPEGPRRLRAARSDARMTESRTACMSCYPGIMTVMLHLDDAVAEALAAEAARRGHRGPAGSGPPGGAPAQGAAPSAGVRRRGGFEFRARRGRGRRDAGRGVRARLGADRRYRPAGRDGRPRRQGPCRLPGPPGERRRPPWLPRPWSSRRPLT